MKKKVEIGITILALVFIGFLIVKHSKDDTSKTIEKPSDSKEAEIIPVSIQKEPIGEENFKGTNLIIRGSSSVALAARQYIKDTIGEFKTNADNEVPDFKAKFGNDSPLSNYSIDFNGTYIKGDKTESIVLDEYSYTGGANGMSTYKVFTALLSDGMLAPLSSIIKSDKQDSFVSYVKKSLTNWRPEGSEETVVFADSVKDLTMDSFANWSLSKDKLTIYFDKYEIGPGALGAVAFPFPISSIKSFLK